MSIFGIDTCVLRTRLSVLQTHTYVCSCTTCFFRQLRSVLCGTHTYAAGKHMCVLGTHVSVWRARTKNSMLGLHRGCFDTGGWCQQRSGGGARLLGAEGGLISNPSPPAKLRAGGGAWEQDRVMARSEIQLLRPFGSCPYILNPKNNQRGDSGRDFFNGRSAAVKNWRDCAAGPHFGGC